MQHTHTRNSDDGHWSSAGAVRAVQLFSMADSRTERLHVLCQHLTVIAVLLVRNLIQPSLMSAGFTMK